MSETSRNDVDFANTSDPVEPNVPAEVDDGSDLESLDDYDLSFDVTRRGCGLDIEYQIQLIID